MKPHGIYDTAFQAGAASREAEVESLRQQLTAALAENQQLRTNARRVFEQEELKRDQAIAAVIFGKRSTK